MSYDICLSLSGFFSIIVSAAAAAPAAKSLQSCRTLCNSIDGSPPGSPIPGILQARILEWVAIPFSKDHPDPRIKPGSCALQADSLPSEPPGKPLFLLNFMNNLSNFLTQISINRALEENKF